MLKIGTELLAVHVFKPIFYGLEVFVHPSQIVGDLFDYLRERVGIAAYVVLLSERLHFGELCSSVIIGKDPIEHVVEREKSSAVT